MKYIIQVIIILQFGFFCHAQNFTGDLMPGSSLNNSVDKNKKNNFTLTDTNIVSSKWVAPWFVERFKISGGFFLPLSNTHIKVEADDGSTGTDIDFEQDLGLKTDVGTFLCDFQWRASRRSRFDLSYYQVNRSADYTIKKDIVFGDKTFKVDAKVNSFFNTHIYRVSYGYAIFAKPKFEAGVLVGAHIVGGKAGISSMGSGAGVQISEDFGFTAPIPDFGLWGGYAFSDRFAVNAEIDYFALASGDFSGRINAYNILVAYKIIKNLDIALGYTGLNFKVGVNKDHLNGDLKWGYNGPNLTATFSFGNKYWTH